MLGQHQVVSGGWNVLGGGGGAAGANCGFGHPTDLVGSDPLLDPLAPNGGPTDTHLVRPGSPAIDRIPIGIIGRCDATTPLDQRGQPVPAGRGCDSGSVENS